MTYEQYTEEYESLLSKFMKIDPASKSHHAEISSKLADLEEQNPEYAEKYNSIY